MGNWDIAGAVALALATLLLIWSGLPKPAKEKIPVLKRGANLVVQLKLEGRSGAIIGSVLLTTGFALLFLYPVPWLSKGWAGLIALGYVVITGLLVALFRWKPPPKEDLFKEIKGNFYAWVVVGAAAAGLIFLSI